MTATKAVGNAVPSEFTALSLSTTRYNRLADLKIQVKQLRDVRSHSISFDLFPVEEINLRLKD